MVEELEDNIRGIVDLSLLCLLTCHSNKNEISNIINNIECISSIVACSFNLKCFMIGLASLTYGRMSLGTLNDMSLETWRYWQWNEIVLFVLKRFDVKINH